MLIVKGIISGISIVAGTTGLLVERFKIRQYAMLIGWVAGMAMLSEYTGQIIGVFMLAGVLGSIYFMVKDYKMQSVFLACVGYLVNVEISHISWVVITKISGMPIETLCSYNRIIFEGVFAAIICGLMCGGIYGVRKLLYSKLHLQELFEQASIIIWYGLAVNFVIYAMIFMINVSLGEKAGYSAASLQFNNLLFGICLIVSSIVVFQCMKGVEAEERGKAQRHHMETLENYVYNLENMVNDMRAFRHDYKNMLSTMSGYIRENRMEELRDFFYRELRFLPGDSENQMEAWKCLGDIAPMELKGFLYEKMLLVLTKNIEIKVDISKKIEVQYSAMEELIRILGIFIDNAIEAAEQSNEGKIEILIVRLKKGVIFQIKNNYDKEPEILKMEEKGYSTKGEERGMGLFWAKKMIDRHDDMFHSLEIEKNMLVQRLEICNGDN